MSDLRRDIGSLMERFEPPPADVEGISRRQKARARNRRLGAGLTAIVIAAAGLSLAVVALHGSSHRPSGPLASSPRPTTGAPASSLPPLTALSARIVLPSTTMTAGSSMFGQVVVENDTGHVVRASGCLSLFVVALGNDKIKPEVPRPLCLQSFTIQMGSSSYPVTVGASYSLCGGGIRRCIHHRPPPLPPGDYLAMLFPSGKNGIPAPPVNVRVTPAP